MANKKTYFIVGLDLPDGMKKTRLGEYIRQAIICEHGNHCPDHDFYKIDVDSVSLVPMSDNAYKHFFPGKEKKD